MDGAGTLGVGDHHSVILHAHALSMVVLELGNGVDRIEAAVLLPLLLARCRARLPGSVLLASPLSARLADLVASALPVLGLPASLMDSCRVRGCAHALAERKFELTAWLVPRR